MWYAKTDVNVLILTNKEILKMTRAEEVKEVIIDTLSFDGQITDDADLVKDLKIDSLDIVELSMALEEEFGVSEMTEEELGGIATIGDLVRYLQSKVD